MDEGGAVMNTEEADDVTPFKPTFKDRLKKLRPRTVPYRVTTTP